MPTISHKMAKGFCIVHILLTSMAEGVPQGRIESIEDLLCKDLLAGSKIPHPEYCNVFLICENNLAKQLFCEDGVYFNPDMEDCDENYKICPSGNVLEHPDITEKTSSTQNPVTSESSNTPIATNPTYSPTESTTEIRCPSADSERITFLSHERSCSMYYLCYHGKPIPFQCTTGLEWSLKLQRCAPAEIADCKAKEAIAYPVCPEIGMYFMPHPESCQFFLFCLNGTKSKQQCQPFHHWDVNERKCKLKALATCYDDIKRANYNGTK